MTFAVIYGIVLFTASIWAALRFWEAETVRAQLQ